MALPQVPDKPTLDGIEARWGAVWDEQGTYAFDRRDHSAQHVIPAMKTTRAFDRDHVERLLHHTQHR